MTSRPPERRKYYVDGGQVEIAAHLVYELDPDGKQLRVVKFTDYTAEKVRTPLPERRRTARANGPTPQQRAGHHRDAGGTRHRLRRTGRRGTASPTPTRFDLLCHLAFNAPLRTRRERAERLRSEQQGLLRPVSARRPAQILDELLEKYAEHGDGPVRPPRRAEVPPSSATAT